MTMDEFRATLVAVQSGKYASVPYGVYDELFPPGEPDQGARERTFNIAKALGVRIENKVDAKQVWFIRD